MPHDFDYLVRQLEFARGARTQVGLNDAIGRAMDAIEHLREEAAQTSARIKAMDANLDSLLAFAQVRESDEPTDAEIERMFA